ncbi:ABC transporter ATP-binding protein [Bordetella pertussis]|nr:ABC transporter ATP-binding protein [Bordetella pertussis]CFU55964.1 ABC transporter ATP-binding protein [Bordetella pertussis]CPK65693.1 ABC transporter ATP-binding protein [Bordetella pertussis]CPN22183.1 ABC transporter ATP-binding protein [Bordetella pertussis]CPN88497.1 ABC transporter ATP-binding protein [Bordetella pertussis]
MQKAIGKWWRRAMGGIALLAAAGTAGAQAPEPLRVRLDWTPWGVQAAFHLAQQKGWYKQAGLDVTLEDSNGSVTTVQIVGGSDRFDLGHAALASMMIVFSPRPGRVLETIRIDLPRPRPLAVRETAEFGRYVRHIRGLFEQMGLIDEGGRAP